MTTVRRGLLISLLSLLVLPVASAQRRRVRGPQATSSKSSSRSRRNRSPRPRGGPAGSCRHGRWRTRRRASPEASSRQCRTRGSAGATGSSPTGWPSSSRRSQLDRLTSLPGVETVYHERSLPPPARPQHAADRRPDALGHGAHERGSGDEDRDHRRGDRPDASVLLARRVHDARRVPEGSDRLHEREGDRRARLPASEPDLEERLEAVRPGALVTRDARRRESRPATRTRSPRASASPASRPGPTSATTRR